MEHPSARASLRVLLAVLLGPVPAAGQTPVPPSSRQPGGIVAIVNQDVITRRELDRRVALHMEDMVRGQLIPLTVLERERPRLERAILDVLIEEGVLLQDVKKNGITASEADVDAEVNRQIQDDFRPRGVNVHDAEELYKFLQETFDFSRKEYRDLVRNQILVNRLLWTKYFKEPFITPGEIREYYLGRPEAFQEPAELAFRMLSVDDSEEAPRIIEALEAALKEKSFLEVAQEYSSARGEQVILWRKTLAELEEWRSPLRQNLAQMKPGEKRRVRVVNGWRYLEMVEVKPGKRKSFEEAQDEIRRSIQTKYRVEERERVVERLLQEAHVQNFLPPVPAPEK